MLDRQKRPGRLFTASKIQPLSEDNYSPQQANGSSADDAQPQQSKGGSAMISSHRVVCVTGFGGGRRDYLSNAKQTIVVAL